MNRSSAVDDDVYCGTNRLRKIWENKMEGQLPREAKSIIIAQPLPNDEVVCPLVREAPVSWRIEGGYNYCRYYNNPQFSDTVITFLDQTGTPIKVIPAHRIIISCSNYFARKMETGAPLVIQLNQYRIEYLLHAIGFLYGCPLEIKFDQLLPFYELSRTLGIALLHNKLNAIITGKDEGLSLEQRIKLINLAWRLSSDVKEALALSLLPLFDPKRREFFDITRGEVFAAIFSSDRLPITSEIELLRFVENWALRVPRSEVEKVLPFLRLPTIIPEVKGIKLYDLLSGSALNSSPLYRKLVLEAVNTPQQYGIILPNRRNIPRTSVVDRLLAIPSSETYFARIEQIDCKVTDDRFSMIISNKPGRVPAKLVQNSDLCKIPVGVGSLIELRGYQTIELAQESGIEISELVVIYANSSN